ncbi:hypothetical protein GBF38_007793 [Nibea albiflora]|uniref:Uncharacterized protein n=1 Tax=Nibea albiflora TaxID=240163 RepID=A0ACB7ENT8_NIBAL|nr:hypothetical protein GBF38_007793 [Nibea albiflora]
MLFLPAAALCCLCSALVATAAELTQDDLTLTRRVGEEVSFSCGQTHQCDYSYVLWFQKKETFSGILAINMNDGKINSNENHPQKDDFSAERKQNVNEQVVKPVVSVYPAASGAHLEGKSSLLCVASAMFPPLVQFSWKRQKEDGPLVEVHHGDGEQLELRESGHTVSILLIQQHEDSTYKFRCHVKHEGDTVEAQIEQEVPAPAASCPPEREPADLPALQQADLLIVKSLVYCCGLSLLMILRNKGPSTNCTHAD